MNRAFTLAFLAGALMTFPANANSQTRLDKQENLDNPRTFRLWEGDAPGAKGTADEDIPTLTFYAPWPENKTGTAVIVAPGGSYQMLASNHEGRQTANWLNSLGVAAFVLKYRLGPKYHYPVELEDAQRAIRYVRAHAASYGVSPARIGMLGFSAGGHLTSLAGTHFDAGNSSAADPIDRVGSRPDFLVLGYPVITMLPPYAHEGSVHALLGEDPTTGERQAMSNELHVARDTPPAFLFSTTEDQTVPVENSVMFYLALRKAGVPAELHVFEKGPHGVGLDLGDPVLGKWPGLLANWLRSRGLLEMPQP
jgi:acetyl esterase/lipase